MDPVDILEMAVNAACMIRSSTDPQALLAEAYRLFGGQLADPDEPLSLRITRLIEAAGERRSELHEFLRLHRGPLYLNRPDERWTQADDAPPYEPDPEIPELRAHVQSEEAKKHALNLFGKAFPPFALGRREVVDYVAGEGEELPPVVRGLIDYPLHKPVLFPIEAGADPWNLWDILSAFADQYARIYEQSQRYGVWGHDLSDLWIERLFYFPERRLIYPYVGS